MELAWSELVMDDGSIASIQILLDDVQFVRQ